MRGTENGSTAIELNVRTFKKQLTKKKKKTQNIGLLSVDQDMWLPRCTVYQVTFFSQ